MKKLNPIIILSSSQRSGSTLLQRLLCSAENALIYGDPVGHEVEFLVNYAASKRLILEQTDFYNNAMRESVIGGSDDQFIASMTPEKSIFLDALKESALHWLKACEQDAHDAGRDLWGWKLAGVNGFSVNTLAEWLPEARFITLSRNLTEVIKSAKAAQIIQCDQGFEHVCKTWEEGNRVLQQLASDRPGRVLELDYTSMIDQKKETISQLEKFTGAIAIKHEVFAKKMNQYGSDSVLPPDELTEAEKAIISNYQKEGELLPA